MEYRRPKALPPLAIPPDLSVQAIRDNRAGSSDNATTYSEYQAQASPPPTATEATKLAAKPRLKGHGERRRLVVPASQAKAWERIRRFWLKQGAKIKAADSRFGLMKIVDSAGRNGYRVHIEPGKTPRTAIIYLEPYTGNPDSGQEAAVLRQLADFLGALPARDLARARQSTSPAASRGSQIRMLNGGAALQMEQHFPRAWRRIGQVLEEKGFAVKDRNRSQGVYYIRYDDPFASPSEEDSGWFSALAFWEETADKSENNRYRIKLIPDGPVTRVVILDAQGRREESETAKRLISLLSEQLTRQKAYY